MNGLEIYSKLQINSEKIREALNTFVLNPDIKKLIDENNYLRSICPHEFVDGVCKYCDTEEKKHD